MVEIIPKIPQKISKRLTSLFYFAIFLLFFSIIAFFVLNSALKKAKEQLVILELDLAQKMSPQEVSLEKEVLTSKETVEKFSYLIKEHLETSRIFENIEKNCHPQAWFSSFSFDPRKGQVIISGEADNFIVLGQQIFILKEEEKISKVDLSKIAINPEGKISFDLLLLFKPNIFNNQ